MDNKEAMELFRCFIKTTTEGIQYGKEKQQEQIQSQLNSIMKDIDYMQKSLDELREKVKALLV